MADPIPSAGPLAGIRILDLTSVILGPYATQILADFGADVIKVEAPSGDIMRHVGPMRNKGMGHIYLNLNRNKRSVVLDLKQEAARDALRKLSATADVFVTNVRPAAMTRLGLGYDDIRAVNPRIVYTSATGFGARGRYAGKPAYDDLIQGLSGIAAIAPDAWGGEPRYMPIAIADRTTGLYLANAISAALFHRERTGLGQAIEIPMFEVFVEYLLGDHLSGLTFDPPEGPQYYPRLVSRHRRPYATKDGYVCALVYTDQHWKNFFRAIGREDLLSDPRFATHGGRADNIDEVYVFVADTLKTRTTSEWIALLEKADIPVAPLHTVESLLEDPHLNDAGFFRSVEHPTEGRLRMTDVPGSWSESQPTVRSLPPNLGEHTAEVLREAGLTDSEIEAAMAHGKAKHAG
jgi:crotonobetainyl-CoA:carnitine CoA-transferase CaiB-like acyl-CoA transferase